MASKKRTFDQAIGKSGKDSHDHPERCIAIFPFPQETTEQQIREYLNSLEVGKYINLNVKPQLSRFTGRPIGLRADIELDSEDSIKTACQKVKKTKFNGKALRPTRVASPEVTESLVIKVVLSTEVPKEKIQSAFPNSVGVFQTPYYDQFCYLVRFETHEASAAALKAFSGSIEGQTPVEKVRYGKPRPPKKEKKRIPPPQKKKKVEQPKAQPKAQPKKAEAKTVQPKKPTEAKEAKKAQPQKTEAKKTQPKKTEVEKSDSKKPAAKEVQAKKPESKKAQPKKTEAKVAQTKKN